MPPAGVSATRPAAARAARARRHRRHRRLRFAARVALVLVLAGIVGTGTFVAGLLAAPIDLAVVPPPTAVLLLASDGRQFATLQPAQRYEDVLPEDIPQVMRDAIISAEDERFLSHGGVDALATVRAAWRDLTGGSVSQGGSTLTQQYVKNAFLDRERTAVRKIREAALAVRLEQKYSKQEILTRYLNSVYLGNNLYGVQAASKYYFGVPVKDLDLDTRNGHRRPLLALARASMLAGIAPAPSLWNPVKDYPTARNRQQYTLNRMVVGGLATPQQVSDAFHLDVRPLRVRAPEAPTIAPEFADEVKARMIGGKYIDEEKWNVGGLRVKTTLDLDLQQAFNEALQEVLPDPDDPQAAIVAVDYRTGDVKAMSTLRRRPPLLDAKGKVVRPQVDSYEQRVGFNLATKASRSTGSTIKPFTLAVALQQGMTLGTTRYAANCVSIPNPGGKPNPYRFCNSDKSESGRFSLRRAMADSVNTVYLPLARDVGRKKVYDLAVASGLKIDTRFHRRPWGPLSFGIGGGVEVSPLSEAVAFGTFANEGRHVPSRFVTELRVGATGTDPGEVFLSNKVGKASRVMSKEVASDVVEALTDVVRHGTGTGARRGVTDTVFGKTGTTNSATDAWFTGCLPEQHLCIATWMGYEYLSCKWKDPNLGRVKVDGPCGGMKKVHGHRLVYGGTLPAEVFAKAQVILKRIKKERELREAGLPVPTAKPTATKRPRASHRPEPAATVRPSRTPSPTPSPRSSPTPPVVVPVPTSPESSSPPPSPGPSP
jgi:membrane peptidoglycan carboxypeptidase